jgi:hypothetical protein
MYQNFVEYAGYQYAVYNQKNELVTQTISKLQSPDPGEELEGRAQPC